MSNKEYIMNLCHCGENDSIAYKPYVAGRLVNDISVNEAVSIIEKNKKELQEIGLMTDEQCLQGARSIFKKHVLFLSEVQ